MEKRYDIEKNGYRIRKDADFQRIDLNKAKRKKYYDREHRLKFNPTHTHYDELL